MTPPVTNPASSNPTSIHKKHPCVLCQQRKIKCDRTFPCSNCKKSSAECISQSSLPPRQRKRRFPEAELLARLRKYEQHLRSYGADIDAINREESVLHPKASVPVKTASSENLSHPDMKTLSVRQSLKNVQNNIWDNVNQEFRDAEELLQGTSDDEESIFAPISRTFDSIETDERSIPFGSPMSENLKDLHPSPVHIFRLWQTYLDNVNPITKLFHSPTTQQQVLNAASDLEKITPNVEALMFGIYTMGIVSLDEDECTTTFGEEKNVLLSRFQSGARQALVNAGYLKSSDLTTLRAFTLYLLSCMQMTMDPRSLCCLIGIAVRIGQRVGLSTDGTSYGLPPFEVEMRRRLWWQIVMIDTRIAEMSGAGPSVLTYSWSTKLPSNINDSDLFPDMKEMPSERSDITEALFLRLKCEVAQFTKVIRAGRESISQNDVLISEFERRITQGYLTRCDPSIPLHFLSITVTRAAFSKLRIGSRFPHRIAKEDSTLSESEKDTLFRLSMTLLESHNTVLSAPSTKRFQWHLNNHFPLPAVVYLVCALRYRTTDELAESAWQLLDTSHFLRGTKGTKEMKEKNSAIYFAISNLTIKAWEARELVMAQKQLPLVTPEFIVEMLARRTIISDNKRANSAPDSKPAPAPTQQFSGEYQFYDPSSVHMDQSYLQPPIPGYLNGDISDDWAFWDNVMQGTGGLPDWDQMKTDIP